MIPGAWFRDILACPDCSARLNPTDSVSCTACGFVAELSPCPDFRPRNPRPASIVYSRATALNMEDMIMRIETARPENTFQGPPASRESGEFLSQLTAGLGSQGDVLDLGGGPADQKASIEFLGYRYVSVDYTDTGADLLGDAHALPFADAVFDGVFSYAVLEHLHHPVVALGEIARILKPGGIYIGSVSQGEPFHASYLHHTAWGLVSLVADVPSLTICRLWSGPDTLESLSRMGRYPRVIKSALGAVAAIHRKFPFLAPRRMRWPQKDREIDAIHRAGSICFTIRKGE